MKMVHKRSKIGFVVGATALATVLVSAGAWASPDFPTALKDAVPMDCLPSCTICHTTSPGTSGTASQPFADAMQEAGLVPGDVDTVAIAYEALDSELDSDSDGESDKDELAAEGASDPNVEGVGAPCAAEIRYGCSTAPSAGPSSLAPASSGVWAWLTLVGLALLGVVTRRVVVARRV